MGVVVAFEDKEAGQGAGQGAATARIETLVELKNVELKDLAGKSRVEVE